MIDVQNENLYMVNKLLPQIPGQPHISTLIRWYTKGVRGVKLETALIGGRRFTSLEAIQRFIDRLTGLGHVEEIQKEVADEETESTET